MKKISLITSIVLCYILMFSMYVYADTACAHKNTTTTYSETYTNKTIDGHSYIKQESVYCHDCNTVIKNDELENKYVIHHITNYHSGTFHYLLANCVCEFGPISYKCDGPPCVIPYFIQLK